MPRIERYTRGVIKPRAVADTVNTRAVSDAVAPYAAAAEISGAVAETTDRFVQAQEATAVNEAIIKNKKQKMEYLEVKRQENMSNPADFAKRIEPDLKKIDEQMSQSLPTGRAKAAFHERMQQVNLSAYENNFQWERARQVEMFAESVERSALDLGNMAFMAGQKGGSLDDIKKDAQATVIAGSTIVSPEKVAGLGRDTMKTIERNYAMGLMESSPQSAIDYLNDAEQSGSITAGDRANLINTAQNVIKANEREAERVETKRRAEQTLSTSMIKDRVFNGEERPQDLILEIRKMEANEEIDSGTASDLVKVVNAKKASGKAEKVTEAQKNDFFIDVKQRVDDLVLKDDFTINKKTLSDFQKLESDVYQGMQDGLVTSAQSNALLKDVREQMSGAIDSNNVDGNPLAKVMPGIQYPISHVIGRADDMIGKSPTRQRMVLAKFSDLIGRVDKDGNILPEGEYKSSGNSTIDKEVIGRTMKKAIELHNKGVMPDAAEQNANDVVPIVGGTFDTVAQATKAAKEQKWADGTVVYIGGVKQIWRAE